MPTGPTNRLALTCLALLGLAVAACSSDAEGDDPDAGSSDTGGVQGDAGDTGGMADGMPDSGQTDTGGFSTGSATLTIGDETWTFDSFACAFGHDATESDVYSFSSGSFGEHSSGARVQMLADIRDETGTGRYEGDGVIYELSLTDIEDFENPAVHWESTNDENPVLVEAGLEPPSGDTVITIDGDSVTAEGFFDDKLTEGEFERVAGTLVGICGDQSRR